MTARRSRSRPTSAADVTAAQLIVLRHGRTEWNARGLFQGQADIALDARGRAQAEQAAEVLSELAPAAIVSSDLGRARQTAAPLAARVGLEVTTDRRLREIHVGSWEGLTAEEVVALDPVMGRRWLAGEDVRRSETGETVAEVADRVATALTEIGAAAAPESTVVVVMHGLAARVGVCRLVGWPEETWRKLGGLHNCGWISLGLHHSGEYWRVEEYNVTAPRPPRSIS
jgi:glucosyl-3-phosphoglycerate phosphatase